MAEPWIPTHRIVFTPLHGGEAQIEYVMLHDEGAAYSRAEWEATESAAWEVVDGEWLCQGQATPGGQSGDVEIETLTSEPINYRAAFLISDDGTGRLCLTGPEHADLSDADLLTEARAEMRRVGIGGEDCPWRGVEPQIVTV